MLVRVVNDNVHPFRQVFKEKTLSFGAKGSGKNFIDMERDEAVQFVGKFSPPKLDYDENPLPESFKMLHIEAIPDQAEQKMPERHVCQACTKVFDTDEELQAHIDENHLDQLADPKVRDARLKAIAARRAKAGNRGGSNVGTGGQEG